MIKKGIIQETGGTILPKSPAVQLKELSGIIKLYKHSVKTPKTKVPKIRLGFCHGGEEEEEEEEGLMSYFQEDEETTTYFRSLAKRF